MSSLHDSLAPGSNFKYSMEKSPESIGILVAINHLLKDCSLSGLDGSSDLQLVILH